MAISHEIQKRIVLIILVVFTAILGYWYFFIHNFESTDNAYIKGNITIISPRISGYIVEVNVQDNQHVEAGQVIAKIDNKDYKARVNQAAAQVDALHARMKALENQLAAQNAVIREAEANVKAAQASYNRAQKEFVRTKTLIKDGAISKQIHETATAEQENSSATLERSKAALDAAGSQKNVISAQIEELKAQIKSAESSLELAQIDLENTEIKAIKAGLIGNRTVQIGQLVRPGTALAYFVPDKEVWIEANFKENQINNMRPAQKAKITIDSYPGKTFYGFVDSLAPASGSEFSILPPENATGNFTKIVRRIPVKIVFDEEADMSLFKLGMSTYVTVKTSKE